LPESFIGRAVQDLSEVLASKNSDYKIDGEFSNFEFAAKLVGDADVPSIIIAQLGIKLGRLKGLPVDPYNESRLDTFRDLAGYAVILYAHALSEAHVEEDDEDDDSYPGAEAGPWAGH